MNASTFHPVRLGLYAALSAADLGLTYVLIRHGEGDVYESNPIAEAWLSSYGWAGLAVFKLLIVLIVAGMATFISLSRPRTGGHVLSFACLSVAAVVGYSVHLSYSQEMHARFIHSPNPILQHSRSRQLPVTLGFAPMNAGVDSATTNPWWAGR